MLSALKEGREVGGGGEGEEIESHDDYNKENEKGTAKSFTEQVDFRRLRTPPRSLLP